MQNFLKTPETTVYRNVNGELVVIQLETSRFYYFSSEAEAILDFFKSANSLDGLIEQSNVLKADPKEIEHIKEFCHSLLDKKILQLEKKVGRQPLKNKMTYRRPTFLREGEKTLDQISFASP